MTIDTPMSLSSLERRHDGFGVFEQQALKNFQLEPVRLETGRLQGVGDSVHKQAGFELRRRQVHRHGQILRPTGCRAAGFAQHPGSDLVDQPHFCGEREEIVRRDQRAVRRRQTYQRLEADQVFVGHFEDRLVMQHQTVMRDRVADDLFQGLMRFCSASSISGAKKRMQSRPAVLPA